MVKTIHPGPSRIICLVVLSLVYHFTRFYTLQQKYFKEKDYKFCLHHHRQLNQISDRFPLTGTTEEGIFAQKNYFKFQACSTFS